MDAILDKKVRNSRWSREPVIGRDGAAVAVYPTVRDIEIFKLIVRFRYLPADYIHAFVGGSLKALSHRLNLLSRKPNLYLARPHQQRQCADANYRRLVYQLDERGSRTLRERGLSFLPKTYHGNFNHELMVAQITASIELGASQSPNIRLITWPEILASENTPKATRESATPASIRASYSLRGEMLASDIIADACPFGLERAIDGKRSYLFFPGIEADCGTEPIDAGDPERSSIAKKFAAYLAIVEKGVHRSHFGFPNFFVPFITTSGVRMRSMMELLDRLTAGQGSKILLFKTFPSFTSAERPPAPSGHMLTEPWQRVGYPPPSISIADLAMDRRAEIIALNDWLRTSFKGGRVQMTPSVYELDDRLRGRALAVLARYDKFHPDSEHDWGTFIFAGFSFEWRIEYRGKNGTGISPDPANPDKTLRVLTLYAIDDVLA